MSLIDVTALGSRLEPHVGRVRDAFRAGDTRVRFEGTEGSGRTTLTRKLSRQIDRAVLVSPPPLDDHDAVAHALYQSISVLERQAKVRILEADQATERQAEVAARELAANGHAVILLLHSSWTNRRDHGDPQRLRVREEADKFLGALFAHDDLPIALVTSRGADVPGDDSWATQAPLGSPLFQVSSILGHIEGYPAYERATELLRSRLGRYDLTPLQLRLAVALLALGEASGDLVRELRTLSKGRSTHTRPLETRLIRRLRSTDDLDAVRRGLCQLSLVRSPISSEALLEITSLPQEHTPLATECLAYGVDDVRVAPRLRFTLGRGLTRSGSDLDHLRIASVYKRLDGADDVVEVDRGGVVPWCERVHHLAHSGEAGETEWRALHLRSRDLLLDRAWSLSVEHRRYEQAAGLYEEILQRFGSEDSYCQHYAGFNLDKAAVRPHSAEEHFRKAVELDHTNPWWNARLVNFLISRGRIRDADTEWTASLQRLDPEEELIRSDPWFPRHVHYWVAREWLDHGEVERADKVLALVPGQVIDDNSALSRLRERLEDAKEARQLGETVYPPSVATESRWKQPDEVPDHNGDGSRLVSWHPGRVVSCSDSEVRLVLAEPESKRVFVRDVTGQDWRAWAGSLPSKAAGFLYLARFEDGTTRIQIIDARAVLHRDDEREREILRYLSSPR